MNLLTALDVHASGLAAQRKRVETLSANIANSKTTRTEESGPSRREDVVSATGSFEELLGRAMNDGVSDVTVRRETAHLAEASRSYEAGITAIGIVKAMIDRTLEIGR